MSRSKNYRYWLCMPLAVLAFLVACGSSPTKPRTSPSHQDEPADANGWKETKGAKDDADDDEKKSEKTDRSDSDKSEGKSSKKAAADDDDDKSPVDDSRTTAAVTAVFKEQRKAFKKCYEDVRKTQPDLKGNVLLKVVLDADGQVKKAFVDNESSIRDQKVVDCMIKLAKSLTYPKSSKGLDKDFEYDFGFNNAQ